MKIFLNNERGNSIIEYIIILGFLAMVILIFVPGLKETLVLNIENVVNSEQNQVVELEQTDIYETYYYDYDIRNEREMSFGLQLLLAFLGFSFVFTLGFYGYLVYMNKKKNTEEDINENDDDKVTLLIDKILENK